MSKEEIKKEPSYVVVPLPPNSIFEVEKRQWISIARFSDKELKKFGKEWTIQLLEQAKIIRNINKKLNP